MISEDLTPKQQHERLRLTAFIASLRRAGRSVSEPEWSDAPDAWVVLDGERTALELGCAYASPAKELYNQPPIDPPNLNFSSSGDDQLADARIVDAARLRTLLTELQRHLTKKCGHQYGRSYLVLDGSHDPLDERMTLPDLTAGLIVPAGCGFTGIYLVVPRFETPRRFVLLARRL
jgi:hypothetical protein